MAYFMFTENRGNWYLQGLSESKGWRVRASGCDANLTYYLCDFEQDTTSLNLVLLISSIRSHPLLLVPWKTVIRYTKITSRQACYQL